MFVIDARSYAVLAMAPAPSKDFPRGYTADMSKEPIVTFMPKRAAQMAGCVKDPSVSVPIAQGANPAATATALPDDGPAGVYCNERSILHDGSAAQLTLCPRRIDPLFTPPSTKDVWV